MLEFDEFDMELEQRKGKPYYVPEKEELLKYRDNLYFEITGQLPRPLKNQRARLVKALC